MGTVSVTTIATDTETITKATLNGLAGNLVTEFNGEIDNDNISTTAAIAYSKLNLTGGLVIADHSASGTPGNTTFLRGDNAWAVPTGSGTGDLLADGTIPLTANWDVGAFTITGTQFISDIATGTAPFTVASTTVVANLNASTLEGNAASAFASALGADDNYVTDAEKVVIGNTSGTNSGDNTVCTSGDATTAVTLKTARDINGVSFDGSANITVTADANTLSNTILKSTVVTSSLTTVGTIASGVWSSSITGATLTDALTLSENASLRLDPAGSADGKYTGITFIGNAGETVAFGDVVYLLAADSEWYLADATDVTKSGTKAIAICVSSGTNGNPVTLMTHGIIRADAGFPALTIGAPVYISLTGTTTNTVTVTAPSATDEVVQIVGYALTANEMLFNPSPDHITVT